LLLMVGHAAKAGWMVVTRRPAEALAGVLPLLVALFVPLCFALPYVYPWVLHPDEHKKHYLSAGAFLARSALYFVVLVATASLLRRWSRTNDAHPSPHLVRRMRALSGGGLPVVALTLTWAAFDWTMSLQPEWSSTIFGLYFFAGAFVAAVALVAVIVALPPLRARARVTPDHSQALGRVLLAMVTFWAYMAFSQLLIYWIADIPAEITFYGQRMAGSWTGVTVLLVAGHFVVPFFALLNRRWKRSPGHLALVSAWVLAMHYVDVYWLILPVHDVAGVRPHWLDAGAVLFVGGICCAWITRRYFAASPLPLHDPDLTDGLDYEAAV
jgi:hypothetical protein